METIRIAWEDNRGEITITPAEGTTGTAVASPPNEGIGRRQEITFHTSKADGPTVTRTVHQQGKRETFRVGGLPFRTKGAILGVLKSYETFNTSLNQPFTLLGGVNSE